MNALKILNSDVANDYVRTRRLSFMFSSLRVRGLLSRHELAAIASRAELDYDELIERIHSDDRSLTNTLRKGPLLDLAWIVGNQNLHEQDIRDSEAIYEFVLKHWGRGKISTLHHLARVDYSVLKLKLGQPAKAREAVRGIVTLLPFIEWAYPKAWPSIRIQAINEGFNFFLLFRKDYTLSTRFLKLDIANPFRGLSEHDALASLGTSESKKWLARLNHHLIGPRLAALKFVDNPEIGPLESLTADLKPGQTSGIANEPKVTIVISAFRPDRHIFTAVKSALNQTYRNLEVLVIDDASGSEFDDVLARVAALDSRVTVLRQLVNGGTYRIRNRALDEATGELITFQDSDDWMHPQRVEAQVKHLLKHPNAVANTSMSTRLTDRLEGVESLRRLRVGICEPSLMFWRVKVRDKIGYFDGVRKGGDTEYRKRLDRAFGTDSAMVMPWRCLTLQRADNGGLTQGELGFRWISEFRLNYRDFWINWAKQAHATGKLRIERDNPARGTAALEADRPFYAPRQSRLVAAEARAVRHFDVVAIANPKDPVNAKALAEFIETQAAAGRRVAVHPIWSFYPRQLPRTIRDSILDLINAGKAELAFEHDELRVGEVVLFAPNAWLTSYNGTRYAWVADKVIQVAFETSDESWHAEGPKVPALINEFVERAFGKG